MYFYLQKPQKGVNLHVEKSQKRVKWSGYEAKDISATA